MEKISVGPNHPNQFKTLTLLKLYDAYGDAVFFMVGGSAIDQTDMGLDPLDQSYHFDEHSCPTNYVPVEAIIQRGNSDPHGVFDYVRSVWMPADYDSSNSEDWAEELFPEISE